MSKFFLLWQINDEWTLESFRSEDECEQVRISRNLANEHYTFSMEDLVAAMSKDDFQKVMVLEHKQLEFLRKEVTNLIKETQTKSDALNYLESIVEDYGERFGTLSADEKEPLQKHVAKMIKES